MYVHEKYGMYHPVKIIGKVECLLDFIISVNRIHSLCLRVN
jgi:hypothetical protein